MKNNGLSRYRYAARHLLDCSSLPSAIEDFRKSNHTTPTKLGFVANIGGRARFGVSLIEKRSNASVLNPLRLIGQRLVEVARTLSGGGEVASRRQHKPSASTSKPRRDLELLSPQMLLDSQRILSIGIPPGAVPVRSSKFFDTFNVNDFQLLAWNAESFVAEIEEKTGHSFQGHYHLFVYRRLKELYEEKIIPILDWIKHGHVLVVFPHLFSKEMKTDGVSGTVDVDINQFPPFDLVDLRLVPELPVETFVDLRSIFDKFSELFKCDLALSGEGIVPLFRTRHEGSTIAGAAFWVGKGAIVFSPPPKNWTDPKLLDYFETLAKLPEMLRRPVDLLPETTSRLWRPALWLAALPALIIAAIMLSFFFAPPMERLLSSGGERSAAGQDYATLDARLTEIEKRIASSSFDVDAIRSAESELARRVDRLEAALSRLQELPASTLLDSSALPTPRAAISHLSNERPPASIPPASSLHLSSDEITELLARGDTLLRSGDIASARLFYERAANAGNGRAALVLGATFDPVFLGRGAVPGVPSDPAEARLWYQRARDLGEADAERRLKSFEAK